MDHQTQKNLPPFEYKALLPPQANQHWSAHQIYDHHNHHHHHQPVYWLGRAFTTQEQQAEEASAAASASSSYQHQVASMIRFPETSLNFQQPPLNHHLNFNYQQNEEEEEETSTTEVIEEEEDREKHEEEDEETLREYMFEKPLTPSDVGKLNRLVIPKQHAEKYFPLSGDSSDKGLLLSFEDESGKPWRFRYSYWNSSQSYVLTKGWSRFVKEKRLDAGDVVSFERRRLDAQRLFIRWRRRVAAPLQDSGVAAHQQGLTERAHPNGGGGAAAAHATETATAAAAWTRMFYSAHPYPSHHVHGPLLYQPDSLHAVEPVVENPTMRRTNSKRLRLFGVNLDCQLDESESPRPEHSSSQGPTHVMYSQPDDRYGSYQSNNHKEFDFYPDVRNG